MKNKIEIKKYYGIVAEAEKTRNSLMRYFTIQPTDNQILVPMDALLITGYQ